MNIQHRRDLLHECLMKFCAAWRRVIQAQIRAIGSVTRLVVDHLAWFGVRLTDILALLQERMTRYGFENAPDARKLAARKAWCVIAFLNDCEWKLETAQILPEPHELMDKLRGVSGAQEREHGGDGAPDAAPGGEPGQGQGYGHGGHGHGGHGFAFGP